LMVAQSFRSGTETESSVRSLSMQVIEIEAGGEAAAVANGGPQGDQGGHARTPRTVHGDANAAQIWAMFASVRTTRSKCVGLLG
jgi:hypothetical protein